MDGQPGALDTRLCRKVGHLFEGGDVLRTAVRVAGVVDGVYADVDVATAEDFRPGERKLQHDGVARRYIGDRDSFLRAIDGNCDGSIGERRAAEGVEAELHNAVLLGL